MPIDAENSDSTYLEPFAWRYLDKPKSPRMVWVDGD